jgi:hypothetical protein
MPVSSTPTDITDSAHEDVLPERLRIHLEEQFAIEDEVGRGGMATVWRARRRSDNAVAATVLRPWFAGPGIGGLAPEIGSPEYPVTVSRATRGIGPVRRAAVLRHAVCRGWLCL